MNKLYAMSKSLDEYDLYDERMIDNVFEKETYLESCSFSYRGTLRRISNDKRYHHSFSYHQPLHYKVINVDIIKGSYNLLYTDIKNQHTFNTLYLSFLGFKLCKILKIKT